ncbi:hypothetical protein COL922a_001431 [Colletotrichum nupharicola]|nr:hypothetical protein COL922a_001431 [Colletotrichum nupharicola]
MLNGTTVRGMEANDVRAMTFDMPPLERYNTTRRREKRLGDFLSGCADVGFTHLSCGPSNDRRKECDWLTPHLSVVNATPMAEQFSSKFLPDADGYSFSGRFRAFLLSTSVPLKATVYAEWHDDRLVPWLHFVPLDNTFQDLYGVLDFFADGDDAAPSQWDVHKVLGKKSKGDDAARWIAEQGRDWAGKVLRREDMRLIEKEQHRFYSVEKDFDDASTMAGTRQSEDAPLLEIDEKVSPLILETSRPRSMRNTRCRIRRLLRLHRRRPGSRSGGNATKSPRKAKKTPQEPVKTHETIIDKGNGSSSQHWAYNLALGLAWYMPAPYDMMPVGYPSRVF